MAGIGATAPRLHGFHRFLPRLWELFFRRFSAFSFLGAILTVPDDAHCRRRLGFKPVVSSDGG
jgi:hypothetical protein